MSKLTTALGLLRNRNYYVFRRQLRSYLRKWRFDRAGGRPFLFRLEDIPLSCNPACVFSATHYLTGQIDEWEMALLKRWLEPSDAVVDVGANLGDYTFAAHHYLKGQGTFLSIDASSAICVELERSARALGVRNQSIVECAVGDHIGEIEFFTSATGQFTGEQALKPNPERATHFVGCRVSMRTLADVVSEFSAASRPALVKLDIEGAEPLALQGAPPSWLTGDGPLWIVEVNPGALRRNGSSGRDLVNTFPSESFERWLSPQFDDHRFGVVQPRPLAFDDSFDDADFYNLIAIPRGYSALLRRARIESLLPTGAHGT